VPSTHRKDTSSVYDENSQFACPAHANCFGTSSQGRWKCLKVWGKEIRGLGDKSPPVGSSGKAPVRGPPEAESFFEIYRHLFALQIDLKRSSNGHFHTYGKSNGKYSIQSAQVKYYDNGHRKIVQ